MSTPDTDGLVARRPRRTALRPLEPRHTAPQIHITTTAEQLVADLRIHFPEFVSWLAREFPRAPLDAFAREKPAFLAYVLARWPEEEKSRVERYLATILRTDPDPARTKHDLDLERFAIQSEGGASGETEADR